MYEFKRGRDKKKRKKRRDLSKFSPFRKSNEKAIDRATKSGQDYLNKSGLRDAAKATGSGAILGAAIGTGASLLSSRGKGLGANEIARQAGGVAHKGLIVGAGAGLGSSLATTAIKKGTLSYVNRKTKSDPKRRGVAGRGVKTVETVLGSRFGEGTSFKKRKKDTVIAGKRGIIAIQN